MRVLQLSKFYRPVTGGIESVVFELTEGLAQRGVRVDVLCANTRPQTVEELHPAGYRVTRAGSLGRCLSTSLAPQLVGLLRERCDRYTLIHVHMPDPMTALALWHVQPKCRIVVHWHSDVVRQKLARRFYRPLETWLLDRADRVIATSENYAASSTALRAWRYKTEIIPIGTSDLEHAVHADEVDAIRRRYAGRRIVFALGRMTYYKGFDVLIRAARALPDDCIVVIGGEGDLLEKHRAEALRLGVADKVILVGEIPHTERQAHFAAAELFCLPSTVRAEAYGVAIIEAMANGKPVVATQIHGSGVHWINQNGVTGLNVPVRDPHALASAINTILGDDDMRQRFGRAARERCENHFRASTMLDATVGLYRKVLLPQAQGSSSLVQAPQVKALPID